MFEQQTSTILIWLHSVLYIQPYSTFQPCKLTIQRSHHKCSDRWSHPGTTSLSSSNAKSFAILNIPYNTFFRLVTACKYWLCNTFSLCFITFAFVAFISIVLSDFPLFCFKVTISSFKVLCFVVSVCLSIYVQY